ncbi:MAG: hypothetical protein ACRD03_17405, partial [Acidimicrobiales bacterium]
GLAVHPPGGVGRHGAHLGGRQVDADHQLHRPRLRRACRPSHPGGYHGAGGPRCVEGASTAAPRTFARRDQALPEPIDVGAEVPGLAELLGRTLGDHVDPRPARRRAGRRRLLTVALTYTPWGYILGPEDRTAVGSPAATPLSSCGGAP